jgi:hypothetical protein
MQSARWSRSTQIYWMQDNGSIEMRICNCILCLWAYTAELNVVCIYNDKMWLTMCGSTRNTELGCFQHLFSDHSRPYIYSWSSVILTNYMSEWYFVASTHIYTHLHVCIYGAHHLPGLLIITLKNCDLRQLYINVEYI